VGPARRLSYRLARPALFSLDAERAHSLTLSALDCVGAAPLLRSIAAQALAGARVEDPLELMGLRFPNRIGLAAGLDKDARHIDGLAALGFGFLELGTVTPLPQPGNPRPRLFRLPQAEALINRFGFNNDGIDRFVASVCGSRTWRAAEAGRARAFPAGRHTPALLGLNIGKNAVTPLEGAAQDYLACLRKAMPIADYVTINISSPNTRNLRQLQAGQELDDLLRAVDAERARLVAGGMRDVPLLLKIAPDLDDAQIAVIAALLTRYSIDGVIATNTTLSREAVIGLPDADEAGGLSGRPVFEASNRVIRALRACLAPRFPIVGAGGVMSASDAAAKIRCGADLVQIYTGLIYRGPSLVGECARAIRRLHPTPRS
jgi:dihydroorotate dehydrogenase